MQDGGNVLHCIVHSFTNIEGDIAMLYKKVCCSLLYCLTVSPFICGLGFGRKPGVDKGSKKSLLTKSQIPITLTVLLGLGQRTTV